MKNTLKSVLLKKKKLHWFEITLIQVPRTIVSEELFIVMDLQQYMEGDMGCLLKSEILIQITS